MALTRWPANRMPLNAEQRQLALDAVKREPRHKVVVGEGASSLPLHRQTTKRLAS